MAEWVLIAAGCTLGLYLALVLALLLLGRREDARAWAGFVPDCVVLFRRLLRDRRISRGRKLLLAALVGYLALPFDLVPDFIPVAGQLDDAIIVAFRASRGPTRCWARSRARALAWVTGVARGDASARSEQGPSATDERCRQVAFRA